MPLDQLKFAELGAEEPAAGEESLAGVKALTAKLKLQTRRPSYLEWEARVRGQPWGRRTPTAVEGTSGHPRAEQDGSICGFPSMEEALEWLKTELQELQAADQRLAQQLMRLRAQLHRLKVEQACHQHKEMLDDATFGLEGCEEDSDLLCTIPPKAAFLLSMPLKHIGVTRMNINSRRFSLC
ncbi:protein FAM167B isoform X1 [Cyrtonyx montezumae]|uniref:protein FAM167B isoform X1 n=1 Tax=Cyrtonyx montezumae TaxID=9017 RepID=UPI0032DA7132